MDKKSVAVRILGQEYRIRSNADEAWLQQVAASVDVAMEHVRERTKTVDTLDVALLTCLNLAREVLELRGENQAIEKSAEPAESDRIRTMIEMAEVAMASPALDIGLAGKERENETPLLTLPTGDEVDEIDNSLLEPLEGSAPSQNSDKRDVPEN